MNDLKNEKIKLKNNTKNQIEEIRNEKIKITNKQIHNNTCTIYMI